MALYYTINSFKHFAWVRKVIKKNEVDTVVISNLLAGYMAAKASKNLADVVFDLPDHFPSLASSFYFNRNSVLGKSVTIMLEGLLKNTFKHSKNIVCCSITLQDYVEKLGFKNVSFIPNGVSEAFLSQKPNSAALKERYGLNGYVTVGYVGSIEFWLKMSPLLKALKILKKKYKLKLMLVGSKLRTKTALEIQKQIENLGIKKDVILIDFVPYDDVPKYISAMDICTIPFDLNHSTAYYSFPMKLLEYLALEKPVITAPLPDIVSIAKEYVNFAINTNDYVNIIEDYIKSKQKYIDKAKQGKRIVTELTWQKIAQKYGNLLKKVKSRDER